MSARFSLSALKNGNGLACPFWKSDPHRYERHKICRPGEGWQSAGKVTEHIWRCHSPEMQCPYCGMRWPNLDRKNGLRAARVAHDVVCAETSNHRKRAIEYRDLEMMTDQQQRAFECLKKTRCNEKKFEKLYVILEKPLPDSYRKCPDCELVHAPIADPRPCPAIATDVQPLHDRDSGYEGSESQEPSSAVDRVSMDIEPPDMSTPWFDQDSQLMGMEDVQSWSCSFEDAGAGYPQYCLL